MGDHTTKSCSRLSLQVEHDDRYLDVGFEGGHGIDGYVVSCESGEVVDGRHCKSVIRLFVNDPVGTYRLFKEIGISFGTSNYALSTDLPSHWRRWTR